MFAKIYSRRTHHFSNYRKYQKISLPHDWANWMIEENRKDQSSEIQSNEIFLKKKMKFLFGFKIEKLMSTYLENALSLEEYRESKNKLVSLKQLLKDKLSAFEKKKSHNRFELTEKFLKPILPIWNWQTREFPRKYFGNSKVGSNFEIKDRTLF